MNAQELIDALMGCIVRGEIQPTADVLTPDAKDIYIKCDSDLNIVFITDVKPYGRES